MLKSISKSAPFLRVHVLLAGLVLGSVLPVAPSSAQTDGSAPALKTVFEDAFRIGAALNPSQFYGHDEEETALVQTHFNSVTPENTMKWETIHPEPGTYDFEASDRFVAFGEEHEMFVVGHTLVWHNQTPDWVFEQKDGSPVSRDTLLRRMRDHIHTVVGRYEGRVEAWDVVNEAVNDDGSLRESPWLEIIGKEYVAKAFQYAREADPDAELYYNDYSLTNPSKRNGTVKMILRLQAQDVPLTGVGLQSHHAMDDPTLAQQDSAITDFAELGVDVMITELDIAVLPRPDNLQGAEISARAEGGEELNPYSDGLPDSMQQALAKRYAELFDVYLDHSDAISRVTFWGVTDADSWLNDWPIPDRTSYPLLFGRDNAPKPAFEAVVERTRTQR